MKAVENITVSSCEFSGNSALLGAAIATGVLELFTTDVSVRALSKCLLWITCSDCRARGHGCMILVSTGTLQLEDYWRE